MNGMAFFYIKSGNFHHQRIVFYYQTGRLITFVILF